MNGQVRSPMEEVFATLRALNPHDERVQRNREWMETQLERQRKAPGHA